MDSVFDFSLFFLIIYFSYIFIYLCVYGCVCVCVCAGGQRLTQGNGLSFHHMAPGDQTAGCTAWHQTPFSVSHLHDPNTFFFFLLRMKGEKEYCMMLKSLAGSPPILKISGGERSWAFLECF